MARLKRRADGELIVVSIFRRHGTTLRCTYQVEDEALERLSRAGVREDQHVPDDLFFNLWKEGLLYTNKTRPGEEPDDRQRTKQSTADDRHAAAPRRSIPGGMRDELLAEDGSLIGFGRFLTEYADPRLSLDEMRTAYAALKTEYTRELPAKLQEVMRTHKIEAIRSIEGKTLVEFVT